jgi:hypothetical protein
MSQEIYNIALGLAGTLGGWWLKVMWDSLKELQSADKDLTEKVSRIEVLVAGNYVKREEFDRAFERLFVKLDSIELKIDAKADK